MGRGRPVNPYARPTQAKPTVTHHVVIPQDGTAGMHLRQVIATPTTQPSTSSNAVDSNDPAGVDDDSPDIGVAHFIPSNSGQRRWAAAVSTQQNLCSQHLI